MSAHIFPAGTNIDQELTRAYDKLDKAQMHIRDLHEANNREVERRRAAEGDQSLEREVGSRIIGVVDLLRRDGMFREMKKLADVPCDVMINRTAPPAGAPLDEQGPSPAPASGVDHLLSAMRRAAGRDDVEPAREPSVLGALNAKFKHTARGFARWDFQDLNGDGCSLQQSSSSIPGGAIWLGCDAVGAPGIQNAGRMHLNRKQVEALLQLLHHFIATGEVSENPCGIFGPRDGQEINPAPSAAEVASETETTPQKQPEAYRRVIYVDLDDLNEVLAQNDFGQLIDSLVSEAIRSDIL